MVQQVRQKGEKFYSTVDERKCREGTAVIGLTEISENVANGEYYYKLGAFASIEASRNTLESVPWIEKASKFAIYAPLVQIFHRIWSLYCVIPNRPCKWTGATLHRRRTC
jgi:uncharacterized protein (DUF169 family)